METVSILHELSTVAVLAVVVVTKISYNHCSYFISALTKVMNRNVVSVSISQTTSMNNIFNPRPFLRKTTEICRVFVKHDTSIAI